MFKTFFSKDKRLLISLLQTFILGPKGKTVEDFTIIKKDQQRASLALGDSAVYSHFRGGKKVVLDLLAHLSTGESINIETQTVRHPQFMERILLYWSKIYGYDFKSGEDYEDLKPAYSLIFTDFRLFPDSKDFLNSFSIRSDKPPHFVLTDHFGMTMVDLSRFSAVPEERDSDSEDKDSERFVDMESAWCYFIENSSSLTDKDFRDLARRGKVFELGERTLKGLSVDRNVRLLEIQREKAIADYYAYIKSAKNQGRKEAYKKAYKKACKLYTTSGFKSAKRKSRYLFYF